MTNGYLMYQTNIGFCPGAMSSQWLNKSNVYFAVKYQTTTDTVYGWVKVDVPSAYATKVKEFSLGSPISGIYSNIDKNNFINIYPIPVNNTFYVTEGNYKIILISIFDMLGKELLSAKEKDVDVSNLNEGIYFVRVKTCEGTLTKKIIIQH